MNPWKNDMVKLAIPAGMAKQINVGGFELVAEDDGTVEVPSRLVAELKAHGLTDPPAAAPTKTAKVAA